MCPFDHPLRRPTAVAPVAPITMDRCGEVGAACRCAATLTLGVWLLVTAGCTATVNEARMLGTVALDRQALDGAAVAADETACLEPRMVPPLRVAAVTGAFDGITRIYHLTDGRGKGFELVYTRRLLFSGAPIVMLVPEQQSDSAMPGLDMSSRQIEQRLTGEGVALPDLAMAIKAIEDQLEDGGHADELRREKAIRLDPHIKRHAEAVALQQKRATLMMVRTWMLDHWQWTAWPESGVLEVEPMLDIPARVPRRLDGRIASLDAQAFAAWLQKVDDRRIVKDQSIDLRREALQRMAEELLVAREAERPWHAPTLYEPAPRDDGLLPAVHEVRPREAAPEEAPRPPAFDLVLEDGQRMTLRIDGARTAPRRLLLWRNGDEETPVELHPAGPAALAVITAAQRALDARLDRGRQRKLLTSREGAARGHLADPTAALLELCAAIRGENIVRRLPHLDAERYRLAQFEVTATSLRLLAQRADEASADVEPDPQLQEEAARFDALATTFQRILDRRWPAWQSRANAIVAGHWPR